MSNSQSIRLHSPALNCSVVLRVTPYSGHVVQLRGAVSGQLVSGHQLAPGATAAREANLRVGSALAALAIEPQHTLEVVDGTLEPAFDLPLAMLAAGRGDVERSFAELSLGGALRPVRGDFATGPDLVLLADGPGARHRAARGLPTRVASTLAEAFEGGRVLEQPALVYAADAAPLVPGRRCFVAAPDQRGALLAAREVAAAHPPITAAEHGEVLVAASLAGLLSDRIAAERPVRAPHHTASTAAMVGSHGRPGEVTLAWHGTLILDEVVEFRRETLRAVAAALRTAPVAVVATHREQREESPTRAARFAEVVELLGLDVVRLG